MWEYPWKYMFKKKHLFLNAKSQGIDLSSGLPEVEFAIRKFHSILKLLKTVPEEITQLSLFPNSV